MHVEVLLVQDMNFIAKSLNRIMVKALAPEKGLHKTIADVMRNLLVQINNYLHFDVEEFFLRTMMLAGQEPLGQKPYAPWIMHFLLKLNQR